MAKWLSGCESKSVLVEFFYSFSFLRNLSYLILKVLLMAVNK